MHNINSKKQNFYNQTCMTKSWFKDLQNDANQIFNHNIILMSVSDVTET